MLCTLLCLYLLPANSHAQLPEINRILVLHGVWDTRGWENDFSHAFGEILRQSEAGKFEISSLYLGLDDSTSAETQASLTSFVQTSIVDRDINLVVSVLPLAGDFLINLVTPPDTEKLFVLPDRATALIARSVHNAPVITSASLSAIRNTLNQILLLLPGTRNVVAIGGINATDRAYFDNLLEVMPEYADRVSFDLRRGENPEQLEQMVAMLDQSSVVLSLPFESFQTSAGELQATGPEEFNGILRASAVPVFGFYEDGFGSGLTGGFLTSSNSYAETTAQQILDRAASGNWPLPTGTGSGHTKYDWQVVERFNLDLDRLNEPYEWINRPLPVSETNPTLVIVAVNVLVLMLLILAFLAVLLHRSNRMNAEVIKAERQARESESKFRLLATSTIDVIWTWNRRLQSIQYCSPSIAQLTGYSPAEFTDLGLSQLLTPESADACRQLLAAPDQGNRILEVEHFSRSGTTVWCEMSIKQVQAQDGDDILVIVTRDISPRRASELERQKLAAIVQQNQKFLSLGTLAGGVAHDFNNALAVIVGTTDLLYLENHKNPEATELLDTMRESTRRATALIKQIMTFSRQTDGRKTVLNLQKLISDTITFLKTTTPPRIRFVTSVTTNDLFIFGNLLQIEQVVFNLVTNSIQAFEDNSGTIRLSLDVCAIEQPVVCSQGELVPGKYALLVVDDNGSGMTDESVQQAFDPFYTSKDLGSGMGLAITRSIVMDHGGAIEVNSQPGEGSAFKIYLPLTSYASEADLASQDNLVELNKKRVVVIDDNEATLKVLCQMLNRLGHISIGMTDAEQALKLIEREIESIDLVVTDYSMPNMDGLEIVKSCTEKFSSLPVVICSGYNEPTLGTSELRVWKSVRSMQKPFSLSALSELLAEIFDR